MPDDIDDWVEKLVADLRRVSTVCWQAGKPLPTIIQSEVVRTLTESGEGLDLNSLRLHRERAKARFDQLIEQNDLDAEKLRLASESLADWFKRVEKREE
jgi:hypothetical protein